MAVIAGSPDHTGTIHTDLGAIFVSWNCRGRNGW